METPKTMIAIPCMDQVQTLFARALASLRVPEGTFYNWRINSLVYDARNCLALDAIRGGYERILWLDSDMIFDPDLLERLSYDMEQTGADLVSGLFFTRRPPLEPVIYSRIGTQEAGDGVIFIADKYKDYPRDAIFPIAACGFGAVLMKTQLARDMLDKYATAFAPYLGFGEDFSFCIRANEMGAKLVCDSSAKCRHIGVMHVGEDDYFRSLEAAPDKAEKR